MFQSQPPSYPQPIFPISGSSALGLHYSTHSELNPSLGLHYAAQL